MSFESKFLELIGKGHNLQDISENIFLNYGAYENNDLIYRIKKLISYKYNCNLNSIKLIGSAQTGFSKNNNLLKVKQTPKDYDFAIIDSMVFTNFFHLTDLKNLYGDKKDRYTKNLLVGKLHPLYQDKKSLDGINNINAQICEELGLNKKVTVCFYLSEKSFIQNLTDYFDEVYVEYLKKISELLILKY